LVFELEPMYATSDRQTDGRTTDADDRLMPPPPLRGRGHNNYCAICRVVWYNFQRALVTPNVDFKARISNH